MTAPITPIETHYAGCRFRSRLEARWAVFFNHLGIPWDYEPQGYLVGHDRRPYLPDFFLPSERLWVEVKGSEGQLDIPLLVDAVIPHTGLPADPYGGTLQHPSQAGPRLLVLGSVQQPGRIDDRETKQHLGYGIPTHTVLHFWKGDITQGVVTFDEGGLTVHPDDGLIGNDSPQINWDTYRSRWGNFTGGGVCLTETYSKEVIEAYRAARSARFEHGEKG